MSLSSYLRTFTRNGCLLILCFVALSAPLVTAAHAQTAKRQKVSSLQSSFDQAKTTYTRIKSSDPNVSDLAAWERSAAKLGKIVDENPGAPQSGEASFLLGELYEQMFAKRSFRPGLAKSVYYYERLVKDYPGNPDVPEALLHLGDLRRQHLKDEAAARSAYYELADVYPKSSFAGTAKLRLGLAEPSPTPAAAAAQPAAAQPAATPASAVAASPTPEPGFLGNLFSPKTDVGPEGKEIVAAPGALKRPTIVIDAGHGGEELGALGVNNVLEKEVTLNVAKYLDELLRERLRAKTILTRTKDMTLSLADRTKIANDHGADLFISIHANASEYKTVRGIETYYLDNTNDKSSLKLAQRENASLQEAGTDLGFIISDFIQSAKLDESISLAHHLQRAIHLSLSRYYEGVKDLGVKKAPFYVLVGAHMPCVLAEISFIDHPVEGARLVTARYQRLAALGLYQGIKTYFEQRNK